MPDDPTPDQHPAPDPDPQPSGGDSPPGIFAEDGLSFREGWHDDVQAEGFDEVRSMAAQFKDLPSVFKAFKDTKAKLSERTDGMVKVPGKDANDDEIAAWREANGVPGSPDEYEIETPENLPEGVEFQPELLTAFRAFAHKEGMPPALANKLVAFQVAQESAAIAQIQQQQEQAAQEAEKELQQEWGPKWEAKTIDAQRVAETLGLGADHPALGNPDVKRALANVAELISEDKIVSADDLSGTLSPGNEANAILKDEDHPLHGPYWNKDGKYTPEQVESARKVYQQKLNEQLKREGHAV